MSNLTGSFEDYSSYRFRRRGVRVLFKTAKDILDVDDSVIYQRTDRDCTCFDRWRRNGLYFWRNFIDLKYGRAEAYAKSREVPQGPELATLSD